MSLAQNKAYGDTQTMDFKALLIQIRQNPRVLIEERQSFADSSGLHLEQIHTFNVFDHQSFDFHLLDTYNCLFIGGASEASVLKPHQFPFVSSLEKLVLKCIEESYPVFASCFGFQVAVQAMGGIIERDEKNFEMGTYPMQMTPAAKGDPLFYNLKKDFIAVSVHQEKCTKMPDNCELLAFTDACPHAFRVTNKPFWGFQFHPELSKPILTSRLREYQELYTDDSAHYQKVIDSLQDTPEAPKLAKNFVTYVKSLIN